MSWEQTAKEKRDKVFSQIPREWILDNVPSIEDEPNAIKYLDRVLPESENAITSLSLLELSSKIGSGELTSLAITKAYAHRAALTKQLINNLSEIFFDKAFARAKELDDIFAKTGKTVGPLHGIPVSLKDQVNLEGIDSAIGFVGLTNHPKTKDEESVIATILYDLGAVFYVKTTVPMAMFSADTYSNIYGQSLNPFNRKLSPGGSSGGESSLIAAKGGIIGLSTDIGGSIRIPAAFNGLFAIRPSTSRLPYAQVTNSTPDQPIVPSVIGPSARYLEDLKLFVKSIIDTRPWLLDPKVPPIEWREYAVPKKLSFGLLKNNGALTPHPPVARALNEIKEKLEALGHEVVEWEPPFEVNDIVKNLADILNADGFKYIHKHRELSGEPPIKHIVGIFDEHRELGLTEHWDQAGLQKELWLKYATYWRNSAKTTTTGRPVDAFISPIWESTSFPTGETKSYYGTYTFPINYFDFSSVVVPISFVDKTVDVPFKEFTPLNDDDKELSELYDPELFDGLPINIQVVTPRYEEERAIALAKVIYDATHS